MNKIFKFRFSGSSGQVFTTFFENLTENLTLHEFENFVHMVLNTRDHKDSLNIVRCDFIVTLFSSGRHDYHIYTNIHS